jgi:hypothetical protein
MMPNFSKWTCLQKPSASLSIWQTTKMWITLQAHPLQGQNSHLKTLKSTWTSLTQTRISQNKILSTKHRSARSTWFVRTRDLVTQRIKIIQQWTENQSAMEKQLKNYLASTETNRLVLWVTSLWCSRDNQLSKYKVTLVKEETQF